MDNNIAAECEQSFYKVLYHLSRPGQSIVIDETTERIRLQKKCKVYNIEVYRYIQKHPNPHIPFVQSLWENEDKTELTVIEELIDGNTLDELLDRNVLSEDKKLNIALQLCDALIFLHGADPPVIHRDIKAENIMVERDGNVILLDYDAAKLYRRGERRDTILIGTQGSAAPEQYGFRQSDIRTDIYGMGVLLQSMFPDDKRMQRIADRATQMDPKDRYQSAFELKSALENRKTEAGKFRFPVPGFRTGTPWKMITASLTYLLLVYFGLTLEIKNVKTAADLWANRITFWIVCAGAIDLFTDWTHLYRHFPFIHSKKPLLRVLGYVLALAFIIVFWIILLMIIEEVFAL